MDYYGFNKKIKPKKVEDDEDLSLLELLFAFVRLIVAAVVFLFGACYFTIIWIASIFALYSVEKDYTLNYFLGGLQGLVIWCLAMGVTAFLAMLIYPLKTEEKIKKTLDD